MERENSRFVLLAPDMGSRWLAFRLIVGLRSPRARGRNQRPCGWLGGRADDGDQGETTQHGRFAGGGPENSKGLPFPVLNAAKDFQIFEGR